MRQRHVLMIMDANDISKDTLMQIFCDSTIRTIVAAMDSARKMLESKALLIDAVLFYIVDDESECYKILRYMDDRGYTERIPVIVVDTQDHCKEGAAENVYDYGVCDVITDPCDSDEIMKRLHDLLDAIECKKMLIYVFNGIANVMKDLCEYDINVFEDSN